MKKDFITNEFGDEISENNMRKIVKQIQLLTLERIDLFFYNCGWEDSEKGKNMSMPDFRLKKIKENYEFADKQLKNLFLETPKKQFIRAFNLRNKTINKQKMTTENVKGFKDFTGEEAEKLSDIKKILVETFEKYGFQPAETPIIEYENFVKSGNQNDEAISDVFKLKDKGKRSLALRYEFTFQLKRLMQNKKLPYRRYQIGAVFRDEPVKENRLRQFTQCDVDVVGSKPQDEAEILSMASEVLKKLGMEPIILVNNRKIIQGILEIVFDIKNEEMIKEMIRYLDKLDKKTSKEIIAEIEKNEEKSKFNKKMQKIQMKNIFVPLLNTLRTKNIDDLRDYCRGILKNRNEEYRYEVSKFNEGYIEFKELQKYLGFYNIKCEFIGYLARGLSYYNGTVFEIKTNGIRETLVAGGSYIFNDVQCTGISFGLERISAPAKVKTEKEKYIVISLNQDKEAIKLAQKLREKGKSCIIFYGKPSKALEYANSNFIQNAIFVGEKEIKSGKLKVKNLNSGKESALKI